MLTPENASKAALFTLPLVWGCYFLSVCLYTAALLITSALLDQIGQDQPPNLRSALDQTLGSKKQLFLFSISMIGALAIAAILTGILIGGSMQVPWLAEKMGRDFGYFVAFPLELAIVLLFTRPALKLLRGSHIPPTQGIVRMAILFGISAVTAQLAFLLLLEHAAPSFLFQQKTIVGYLLREAAVSLIGASPYIILFIGLSLLAAGDRLIADLLRCDNV